LAEERYYGTGRRKDAVAKVWIKRGTGTITVNGKSVADYFHRPKLEEMVTQPLVATETSEQLDVIAFALGGGIAGQAGALRHGIAKALCVLDEQYRSTLGPEGLLTRDPRVKERKHAGFRRARRGKQFSKR
jgi:small subunit ribosomal protein S9